MVTSRSSVKPVWMEPCQWCPPQGECGDVLGFIIHTCESSPPRVIAWTLTSKCSHDYLKVVGKACGNGTLTNGVKFLCPIISLKHIRHWKINWLLYVHWKIYWNRTNILALIGTKFKLILINARKCCIMGTLYESWSRKFWLTSKCFVETAVNCKAADNLPYKLL